MTDEEMESWIEELELENERLSNKIEDLEDKPKYKSILTRVAERLAELRLIDSYPAAKRQFIEGEREI